MYLTYDIETGEPIGAMSAIEPEPGEGQAVCLVPQSALMVPPLTIWSPAMRGWIDEPWLMLRRERNARLRDCDWTQLPTARLSETERAAWDAYRDALFDLPETVADPAAPIWPIPPA